MEQRVDNVLAMLLPRSPLTNSIPMEDGGYQQVIYALNFSLYYGSLRIRGMFIRNLIMLLIDVRFLMNYLFNVNY